MAFKTILFFFITFSLVFVISCKTPKETDDPSTLVREMELQKNPCFGKCPYYLMTIYKGGIVRFDGRKFVKKFGLYTKKLSKSEYKAIKKAFKKADLWSFKDSYISNIPDLPKPRLTFQQGDKVKSIIGDMNRPQVVNDLQAKMEAIAESDGWTVRSVPNPEIQDYYITDELIISLKPRHDVKEWVKKYESWNMEVVESISKSKNLWLFKFDNPDLNPAQVINLLSLDEDVMILEFNKKEGSPKRN